mgnify:CR=1 FL=1
MNDKREIEAINIQLLALAFAVISAIISFILTYNQKLGLENNGELFKAKTAFKITLFNRILIIILSFIFLYVNYVFYEVSKDEGEDLKPYILQIAASIITIIPGLIALYVVLLSTTEDIADVENPII